MNCSCGHVMVRCENSYECGNCGAVQPILNRHKVKEEVIRCKKCIHFKEGLCNTIYGMLKPKEDDFCSLGTSIKE